MNKALRDPKIIGAVLAGFLVPKITSYIGNLVKKTID